MKSRIHEYLMNKNSWATSKKLTYIALAFSSLFLASCDDEDGFYNEKYVDVPNLVTIETQPTYEVGDYLYLNADISRYLPEPGFSTPLDIYATTSGAPSFVFSYVVEKQDSAGNWAAISTTADQMDVVDGTVQAGSFVLASAVYDADAQSYEYLAGYPLAAAGHYRISFGINSDATNEIELRSKSQGNNLFLNLISDTSQLDSAGFYEFDVQ